MDRTTLDLRQSTFGQIYALSLTNDVEGSFASIAGRDMVGLVNLLGESDHLCGVASRESLGIGSGKIRESQFNFDSSKQLLCALAVEDFVELVEWQSEGLTPKKISRLKGHGGRISDLSWHEQNSSLLAVSSEEGDKIFLWDIRASRRRPSCIINSMNPSSQVCWERISGNLLVSSHDNCMKVWDSRNWRMPLDNINAHRDGILCLDFSARRENCIVSSSLDLEVKFWNISGNNEIPNQMTAKFISGESPVWKVRYTPFGDGLVTLAEKAELHSENDLLLWKVSDLSTPVVILSHMNRVKEFCWRNQDPDLERDHIQLVTLSQDNVIKVWDIPQKRLEGINVPKDEREESPPHSVDQQQCVSLVESSVMDSAFGTQSDSSSVRSMSAASLPIDVPDSRRAEANAASSDLRASLSELQQVEVSQRSSQVYSHSVQENTDKFGESSSSSVPIMGAKHESKVPFPRTSGARFSVSGRLIRFGAKCAKKKQEITPRSLADYTAKYIMMLRKNQQKQKKYLDNGRVDIIQLPAAVNERIAALYDPRYIVASTRMSLSEQCQTYAKWIHSLQFKTNSDHQKKILKLVYKCWGLTDSMLANLYQKEEEPDWVAEAFHHFCRNLPEVNEMQTLALIFCFVDSLLRGDYQTKLPFDKRDEKLVKSIKSFEDSEDTSITRSYSVTPEQPDLPPDDLIFPRPSQSNLISAFPLRDSVKSHLANLLYCQKEFAKATSTRKCIYYLDQSSNNPNIKDRQKRIYCSVCDLIVSGLSMHCTVCQHGGHLKCVVRWFTTFSTICPKPCECQCTNLQT